MTKAQKLTISMLETRVKASSQTINDMKRDGFTERCIKMEEEINHMMNHQMEMVKDDMSVDRLDVFINKVGGFVSDNKEASSALEELRNEIARRIGL